MKINKNSWHYKVVTLNDKASAPRNLCEYFWTFVFLFIVMLSGGFFVYLTIISPIAYFGFGADLGAPGHGLIGLSLDIMMLLWVLGCFVHNFFEDSQNSFLKVIREYLKALKDKVCPLIKYED